MTNHARTRPGDGGPTDAPDRAAHVTIADHAALRARAVAEMAHDAHDVPDPTHHVRQRIICHGCGARVFSWAQAPSGRYYCPTCIRTMRASVAAE